MKLVRLDLIFPPTFKFKCKLIRVIECEHLFVRVLLICIEDQLCGEQKHRKASLHELRLSILLLGLHWLQLSSLSPSRGLTGPLFSPLNIQMYDMISYWLKWRSLTSTYGHNIKHFILPRYIHI